MSGLPSVPLAAKKLINLPAFELTDFTPPDFLAFVFLFLDFVTGLAFFNLAIAVLDFALERLDFFCRRELERGGVASDIKNL